MAQRKHATRGRVNWLAVTIPVVILVLGAILFIVLRGGKAAPPPTPEEAQPPFAFASTDARFLPLNRGHRAPEEEREEATLAVATLMSDMYDAAFVTKDRWQGGTFTSVLEKFAPDAATQAQDDLAELTLGPEAASLERVLPDESSLEMYFLVRKKEPVAAIAAVTFQATGSLAAGGDLKVSHGGRYYLRLLDGVWRIVGYEVEGHLETPSAAVPGPTPGEGEEEEA